MAPSSGLGAGNHPISRSFATQHNEQESLFRNYEHLSTFPRGDSALKMLRQIASLVKPIMRKHNWRVGTLAEMLPTNRNLLGLNYNKGSKISLTLRYHGDTSCFLPLEDVVDTMLHELSHIVWGPHDSNFHRLWDELRDEYETLQRKGYTGEGFLSAGRRLGGGSSMFGAGQRVPQTQEIRNLARVSAEKRKSHGALSMGSGQRLGGRPIHRGGGDVRATIADQIERRNKIDRGCASGAEDAKALSDQTLTQTFKTKAEEDDANDRAIAEALMELMEEEEMENLRVRKPAGSKANSPSTAPQKDAQRDTHSDKPSEEDQMKWAISASLAEASTGTEAPAYQPDAVNGEKLMHNNSRHLDISSASKSNHESKTKQQQRTMVTPKPSQTIIDLTDEPTSEKHPISSSSNDGPWTCQACTVINANPSSNACEVCSTVRTRVHRKPIASNAGSSQTQHTYDYRAKRAQHDSRGRAAIDRQDDRMVNTTVAGDLSVKRYPADSMGWKCGQCGWFTDHKYWSCVGCGKIKESS